MITVTWPSDGYCAFSSKIIRIIIIQIMILVTFFMHVTSLPAVCGVRLTVKLAILLYLRV